MYNLMDQWVRKLENKNIGLVFKNVDGLEFTITKCYYEQSKRKYKFEIVFTGTGYTVVKCKSDILKGLIRDKLVPAVFGVGCLGYGTTKDKKIYAVWTSMLARCYVQDHISYYNYGGSGVIVCDRWLRFDHFVEDFPSIDGYDEERFYKGELQLDKDIKQSELPYDERVYSLETCSLLTRTENSVGRRHKKGKTIVAEQNGKVEYHDSVNKFALEHGYPKASVYYAIKHNGSYKGWKIKEEA